MFQEAVTFEVEECYRKERGGQREERDRMLGVMRFMDSGSDWISGSQKSDRRYLQTVMSVRKEQ